MRRSDRSHPSPSAGQPAEPGKRTSWLEEAYGVVRREFVPQAPPVNQVNLIPAFPHRGARPGPRQVLGIASDRLLEGVDRRCSKAVEIHLRAFADLIGCLATLLHEMIHLAVGVERGHRAAFQVLARRVGLKAPFTTANPSKSLTVRLRDILGEIGPPPPGWADLDPPRHRGCWRYACRCERPQRFSSYGRHPVDVACPYCGRRFTITSSPGEKARTSLPREAVDIHQVAAVLGRSVRTVWHRIQQGSLPGPAFYLCRQAYWMPWQFDEFDDDAEGSQRRRHGRTGPAARFGALRQLRKRADGQASAARPSNDG